MADGGPTIIGTPEAAQILGWTQRKVQRAASTGQIPIVGTLGARGEYVFDPVKIAELAEREREQHDTA